MPDDFYDLLGLPRNATQDDVKRAYREKVREYHPDLNDDPRAQAQFTALKKAYDTLGDPEKRADYDRLGHEEYVAKRINGLPSQDKWATGPSGASSESQSRVSATASTATASTATKTETGRSTSSGGHSTGVGPESTGSTSSGGSDTAGPRRTDSQGRTASRRSRRRAPADSSGLRSRLRTIWRIGVGWPLIFATDVLYVVGLELFVGTNLSGVASGLEAVIGAGTDVGALRTALLQPPLGVIEFVTAEHSLGGVPIGGLVLVMGSLILPLVYGIVIHDTRTSFSAWNPTRLYVVAALGPAVGLAANAVGYGRLGVDLLCFGVLPLGAIALLPTSAFVRPWVLRRLRR